MFKCGHAWCVVPTFEASVPILSRHSRNHPFYVQDPDDQSCFSICSHIQSVIFSDLHSKLHSQCHFQICAKNRVLRYLGERFPGRMCCAFRGSPPELCPISVHVRYGIRMLSVSAFHRCAGRYGTAHWYVRGTEAKMTRRKKIEFKDLRTHTIKG